MNEAQLIEGLENKDPKALAFLYSEYHGRVTAVVRKYIRDEWDVEEVVQDTFWTVHRKIHLFRRDSQLWSWMYRIAANAAKMKLRKYKRRPIPFDDEILSAMRSDLSTEVAEFVRALKNAENLEQRNETGSALAWFLKSRRMYPQSRFAQERIDRLVGKILPDDVGGSASGSGDSSEQIGNGSGDDSFFGSASES